jgi:hypothetical protein
MISKELSKEELLFSKLEYHRRRRRRRGGAHHHHDAFVAAFSARGRYTPGRASRRSG